MKRERWRHSAPLNQQESAMATEAETQHDARPPAPIPPHVPADRVFENVKRQNI